MINYSQKKRPSGFLNFFSAVAVGALLVVGALLLFFMLMLFAKIIEPTENTFSGESKVCKHQGLRESLKQKDGTAAFFMPKNSSPQHIFGDALKKGYKTFRQEKNPRISPGKYSKENRIKNPLEKKKLEEKSNKLKRQLQEANAKIKQLEDVLSLVYSEAELEQSSKEKKEKEIAALKKKISFIKKQFKNLSIQLQEKEKILAKKMSQPSLDVIANTDLAKKTRPNQEFSSKLLSRLRSVFYFTRGVIIKEDRIVFASKNIFIKDTSRLTAQGKRYLSLYIKALKETVQTFPQNYPWTLKINSHTDARPFKDKNYSSNLQLSIGRAAATMSFFCKEGIKGENISAGGVGAYQPIKKDSSMIAHRKNNRLELKID